MKLFVVKLRTDFSPKSVAVKEKNMKNVDSVYNVFLIFSFCQKHIQPEFDKVQILAALLDFCSVNLDLMKPPREVSVTLLDTPEGAPLRTWFIDCIFSSVHSIQKSSGFITAQILLLQREEELNHFFLHNLLLQIC